MSQREVERFLGRIVTDGQFRSRTEESLEHACHCQGFVLSAAELELLHCIDYALVERLADSIDDALKRMVLGNDDPLGRLR